MGHQRRRYVAAFLWDDGIMSEIGLKQTLGSLPLNRHSDKVVFCHIDVVILTADIPSD